MGVREKEFEWISKFVYVFSRNVIVMWSTPVLISLLTFGTTILLGVNLDAATVFTTTSIFKMLQELVRIFQQSMSSLTQAVISFGRLNRFIMSKEMGDDSMEMEEMGELRWRLKNGSKQSSSGSDAISIRHTHHSFEYCCDHFPESFCKIVACLEPFRFKRVTRTGRSKTFEGGSRWFNQQNRLNEMSGQEFRPVPDPTG
ncbi:ABC transporter C family member 4 [Senna tora]|uniref:ABC transporter C family member 4 n=1 Tax=Senna tora TaxID=362788 RepID=A0A834X843_9FABA|nr:ABC transporter C family member 4 [Senna tora]